MIKWLNCYDGVVVCICMLLEGIEIAVLNNNRRLSLLVCLFFLLWLDKKRIGMRVKSLFGWSSELIKWWLLILRLLKR